MVKVERTFPAPASLQEEAKKKTGSYSMPDVIKQLEADFHNKCYICEMKDLQDPQVEHLLPHKNGKYRERKFDWSNLFWVCGHCNGVKNQKKYEEGILDCCKKDPEESICFTLKEQEISVRAKETEDEEAALTAELVQEVFHIQNTGMRTRSSDQRVKALMIEMKILYHHLEKIKKNPNSGLTLRKLKALLRRESAFAAFKRNYVREHIKEYPELKAYVE